MVCWRGNQMGNRSILLMAQYLFLVFCEPRKLFTVITGLSIISLWVARFVLDYVWWCDDGDALTWGDSRGNSASCQCGGGGIANGPIDRVEPLVGRATSFTSSTTSTGAESPVEPRPSPPDFPTARPRYSSSSESTAADAPDSCLVSPPWGTTGTIRPWITAQFAR